VTSVSRHDSEPDLDEVRHFYCDLVRVVHPRPLAVGVLMAAMGVGGIIGGLLSTRITARFGTARALLLYELLSPVFALLVPLTFTGPGLLLFAVGELLLSAGIVAGSVIAIIFRQRYVPSDTLGRVTAFTQLVGYGLIPIGALIGGTLGTALGVRTALAWLAGALFLPLLFLLASPIRRERDLPVNQGEG
jgi:predicted MFS family arabinose efflux permease